MTRVGVGFCGMLMVIGTTGCPGGPVIRPVTTEDIQNATWLVVAVSDNSLTTATAFGIGPRLLGTNAHVAESIMATWSEPNGFVGVFQHETGEFREVTKVWWHPDYEPGSQTVTPDVGILEVDGNLPSFLTIPDPDAYPTVEVFEAVHLCGFPGSVTLGVDFAGLGTTGEFHPRATCLDGSVSAIRPFDPGESLTTANGQLIQYDISTEPGLSGSAVFNAYGEIIGVHALGFASSEQNFAIRIDKLAELVAGISDGSPDEGEIVDGNRNGAQPGEPNDDFSEPVVAVFDENGVVRLQGTVEIIGDLDVFLLGGFSPGDRITVDAYTPNSALDVTIAMFDSQGRLVVNNDDREDQGDETRDAYVDFIVRHAGNPYYLVVTHSPFPVTSGEFVGSYRVDIVVDAGFDVPQPVAQTLLLDFDGGVVNFPVLGRMTLAPFDAADVSPLYEGETDTIKDRIREVFVQNYGRFNVTIVTTDDAPPPVGTMYSTIHFGGFDRGAFGLAEAVDLYNVDRCDDAIIFTETFAPSVFTGAPSASEMGTAIGNVGSHEAGHVLGLNHVDDDRDLMDDQSPADVFLENQEFMEAPLSEDIMPIGTQDGVLLLGEIVGEREVN